MADIRINSLSTTASSTASDDFIAVDGTTNGTRKLNAYSPTFGGNLTVSGTSGVISNNPTAAPTNSASAPGPFSLTGAGWDTTFGSRTIGIKLDPVFLYSTASGSNSPFGQTYPDLSFKFLNSDGGGTYVERMRLTGSGNLSLAGNLTVSGTSGITTTATNGAGLTHSTAAGSYRGLKLQTSSSDRWLIGANDAAESGSNAGSDLVVFSYSDAGTFLSSALKLVRSTGNLLIGTTTDSANGKLQLTSHTTSAGGIGFGTETALYRAAAGSLVVDHIGGSAPTLNLSANGSIQSRLFFNGTNTFLESYTSHSLILRTNQTAALTLDSSQNATFAGSIKTVAPSGGTAKPWELGEAATVSPTSPNRTIRVEIDGTVYYIHAKTTND